MSAPASRKATILMIAAMAGFAIEDMFIKLVSTALPVGQILVALGLVGFAFFATLARAQGASLWTPLALHPAAMARNVAEVAGTLGFVMALATSPLVTATAIFQAMPLAITCGAALFLGETVGWRRWTAVAAGFVGVLMVIRPGLEGFEVTSLWAVLAVLGLSSRDLATRKVPPQVTSVQLAGWGVLSVLILGVGVLAVQGGARIPDGPQALYLIGAMAMGTASYWALTESTRLGDLSAVMPFRYMRLVFALFLGALVFGERPDAMPLAGAGLIVASGLYTIAREQARARAARRQA